MTAQQLIERLSELPKDLIVKCYNRASDAYEHVIGVAHVVKMEGDLIAGDFASIVRDCE